MVSFSSFTHLNNSTDSSSPVDINEDLTINFNPHSNEISFGQNANSVVNETNDNSESIPRTLREEKLHAVSRLFHLSYRAVIPNRPPTISATTHPSAFNPRPIGKNSVSFPLSTIILSFQAEK